MTNEELIEQVAHVLCETGAAASWVPAVQSAYAILPIIKAEVDKWREPIIDELTSLHIYSAEHDADPRKAVLDIVEWNQRLALDPAVSAEARALMVRGGEMVKEAAADWFADRFSDAVQADCESGVKWLNERAAKAYLKDAPDTLAAIREGEEAIRALSVPAIVEAGDG